MKRPFVIAFLGGGVGQVLGGLVTAELWGWSSHVFTLMFPDCMVRGSYKEELYYLGSFWVSLPDSVIALCLGFSIGLFLPGRAVLLAATACIGWLTSYLITGVIRGVWWLTSPPHVLVFTASLVLSLGLVFVGAFGGVKIEKQWRTRRWTE